MWPCLKVRLKALQGTVVGIERKPPIRHLDNVGRIAGGHHGGEFLEGLAPRQRRNLHLHAGVGLLKALHDALERFCPLWTGDDFGELQGGLGKSTAGKSRGKRGGEQ